MLRDWAQHRRGTRPLTADVVVALGFFRDVLPLLRPRVFDLSRAGSRPPILVYTDARYDRSHAEPAQLGVAFFDPELVCPATGDTPACSGWRHTDMVVPPEVMALFREREQYVGQLEVVAAGRVPRSRRDPLHR